MRSPHFIPLLLATFFVCTVSIAEEREKSLLQAIFGSISSENSKVTKPKTRDRKKRIEIDLTNQRLKAYEGNRVVLKTRISSGRTGNTPTGNFRAGPYKSEQHFSSLYHNAPMPWSVQITGHIFIHGFSVVPNYPASKGCVRVPIDGRNPAKKLFKWADVGTPIRIFY